MRILQINSVFGTGSTGRIAADIDNILKAQGHESFIAYGRGREKESETLIKIGTPTDNYMHVAKTRLLDKHGFGSIKATKNFIKKMERLNPDIIHLHNIHGYYVNVELLFEYFKKSDKRVIWTLHDCWAFTGHCSYFDYIGCNKWENGCYSCPQKTSYPSSLLIDSSKLNYQKKKAAFTGVKNMTIVTPSNWLAGIVNKSFLGGYKTEVINNGIDLEVFKPTVSAFRNTYNLSDKFILLGVANIWEKRKGFEYFIELSRNLEQDEIIILVGLSEKQKKSLPNNIIGITKTNNIRELAEIYSSADVFINPTLEDNFPTTNLEALACGTPIITFNTGGSIETVNPNCGFIVDKGCLTEVKRNINIIKSSGKQNYLRNCINQAETFYDKRKKFNEYIQYYEKTLKYLD